VIWQAKLKEMEARLKSKEATMYEADGVAAKVARDCQGNFVFQFDRSRCAARLACFSHAIAEVQRNSCWGYISAGTAWGSNTA
jgi:hypothetical protein